MGVYHIKKKNHSRCLNVWPASPRGGLTAVSLSYTSLRLSAKFLIATHECSAVTSVCEELSWSHFSVCIPMPDFQHLSLISPSCYTDQKTQHFLSQFWDKPIDIPLEYTFLLSTISHSLIWNNNNGEQTHGCFAAAASIEKEKLSWFISSSHYCYH